MKKKSYIIVSILLCLSYPVAGALSGIVTNEQGQPVGNARVSMKKATWPVVYTNSKGEFTIGSSGNRVPPGRVQAADVKVVSLKNGAGVRLKFSRLRGDVVVGVFDCAGKRIRSQQVSKSNGTELTLNFNGARRGMYLLEIRSGYDVRVFRVMPGLTVGAVSFVSHQRMATTVAKQNAGSTDTVIVIGKTYRNFLAGVENPEAGELDIKLVRSSPWISSGASEHSGGMVKIRAKGHDFEMGQPEDIWGDGFSSDEGPVHTVNFTSDFWMDTTEVTQGDYDEMLKAAFAGYTRPAARPYGDAAKKPVYEVSWSDAVLYCNSRSNKEGFDTVYSYDSIGGRRPGLMAELVGVKQNMAANGYRLPTEAEWEYACKASSATDYFWGKDVAQYKDTAHRAEVNNYAVSRANSWDLGSESSDFAVHSVALLLPNGYGLYDMSGNLSEMCNNSFVEYAYGSVTDPMVSMKSGNPMVRGGNWANDISYLRSSCRTFAIADYPYWYIGFRTVRRVVE